VVFIVKQKLNLEAVYILLFAALFIWAGCANLFNYELTHDYPYGFMASDTFQHSVRSEWVKQEGNYRTEVVSFTAGRWDTLGYYMPVMYHLAVIMSYLTGMETFSSAYFLMFLVALFASLAMYIVIRDFNKNIAILSLPLSLFLFIIGPAYRGFQWGVWGAIIGQVFLIGVVWALNNLDLKKNWILLGVMLAGTALGHTSSFIFAVMLVGFYVVIDLIVGRFKIQEFKQIIIGGIFGVLLSLYFLIIFAQSWLVTQPYRFHVVTEFSRGGGLVELASFKIWLVLLIIGFVLGLYFIKKKQNAAIIAGIFLLVVGYTNYVGFDQRAFNVRLFWPIYFSVFFGIAVWQIASFFVKKWNKVFSLILAVLIMFVFLGGYYDKLNTEGMMNNDWWQGFEFLQRQTPREATVLYSFSDPISQTSLYANTLRPTFLMNTDGFVSVAQQGMIQRNYPITDRLSTFFPYWDGFPKISLMEKPGVKDRDVCSFDYVVFDKQSRISPPLAMYNNIIMQDMVKSGFVKPVFENSFMTIVHNEKPGEKCIEDRKL